MQENKMGIMSIKKLIITMSLPIMISMLIQALYNVVDSMFVAQIGESALTAVSLAYPIQNLLIAFSTGIGVGINALVARSLGEKNKDRADKFANNGILIILFITVLFMLFGMFFSEKFFMMQTNDLEVIKQGTIYLRIVTVGCIGIFMEITFERILQATGRTVQTMISQLCGAITNIILDPIMIFGLFGLPKMGIAGAAYATIIGQCVAGLVCFIMNHKLNPEIDVNIAYMKPHKEFITEILKLGFPSVIMSSIGSIMTFGFNQILLGFSKTAIAFFGVYMKLQSFIFMPVFGLNNGLVPIIAYNFGAKYKDRIIETVKKGLLYGCIILWIGFIIFEFAPDKLLALFNPSTKMQEIGIIGLKVIAIHFLIAGINIVLTSFFQALGHGVVSMFISIVRQLVLILPVAALLAIFNNIDLVWWCCPISEIGTLLLSIYFFRKIYKNQIEIL